MKYKKKYFSIIVILILINIALTSSIKNSKFYNKISNRSHSKSSNSQSAYVSVTVDPHHVEADDVGFSVMNVPVFRKPSVSTNVVTNGQAVISHPHQDPIGIQTHPLVNIQPRAYLPNSDPHFSGQFIPSKNMI